MTSASAGRGLIVPADRWPWPSFADLRELWQFRGLLAQLVLRDIRVRYAQTVLGAAWTILQPLVSMAIFWIVFGYFAGMPSGEVPYALVALAGLVPWTYFATVVSASSDSLLASRDLITKVYFPRLIIPLAPILAGLVDLAIAFGVLLGAVLVWDPSRLSVVTLLVPLPVALIVLAAAGAGTWATALNIQYRDVRYAVPFLIQAGLFISPVIYPLEIVPDRWLLLFAMNPLVGGIELLRALVLDSPAPPVAVVLISSAAALALFSSGVVYFRRVEQYFADVA
jgi:lipopolysaccharide transport system permease protein